MIMLNDAARADGEQVRVMDVVEIVAARMR
jgi:hypothetical protein